MGVSGIARDIRERVQAERKLRESEERFREVFEHAPFGLCVTGLDGRIIQAMRRFAGCWDIPRRNCLARPGHN